MALCLLVLLLAGCGGAESRHYVLELRFGGPGDAPGQFHDPTGIAASDHEVFVADARNARIQVFDHAGRLLRAFGAPHLKRPMNLTLAGDELWVPDFFTDTVLVFALDGQLRDVLRAKDGLNSPGGVAVRADGNLLVADTYAHRIVQLNRQGEVLQVWGTAGRKGIAGGRFNYPTDVEILPNGGFVVADGYNDRIQQFDRHGELVRKWGGPFGLGLNVHGPFYGWFATVTSVAVAADGTLFAADFYNHRVQVFKTDGRFVGKLAQRNAEGRSPIAVAVAPNGAIFVTDLARNQVQRWREVTRR